MKQIVKGMVVVDHEGKIVHETLQLIHKEDGLSDAKAEGIAFVRSTEMFVMVLNEMMKQPKPSVIQMANMWSAMEKAGYSVHKMKVTFETIGEPLNSITVSKMVMAEMPDALRDLFKDFTNKMEQAEKEKLYNPPASDRPKREEFRQKGFNTPFDGVNSDQF